MPKRKWNRTAVSLLVITVIVLVAGYFAIKGLEPQQVSYSNKGTTTEYGLFGVPLYTDRDDHPSPRMIGEVQSRLEDSGLDLFLDGSNSPKDWRVYYIDYFESERLGLEMETTANEEQVIDHYREILGDESDIDEGSTKIVSWRYKELNGLTLSIHLRAQLLGRFESRSTCSGAILSTNSMS